MTQSNLTFICPSNNVDQRPAILENGEYSLRCKVCAWSHYFVEDEDPREGVISATLYFGPNLFEGEINETGVVGYSVYLADNCSRKIGEPLGYVEAIGQSDIDSLCCQHDLYSVQVSPFALPVNVSLPVFMVVPNTTVGELSAGLTTEAIVDVVRDIRPSRVATNSAPPPARPIFGCSPLLLVIACLTYPSARLPVSHC